MSAQGLVPSVVPDLDSCTCRDWMRHGQQKDTLEKMPDRTPAGGVEEESDESEEPELPPAVIRRKVSFADAFGLDLVSVKEYDNRDSSGPSNLARLLGAEGKVVEEYYLSCPFTCPASDQELRMRLQDQKLELESIELLPGSTTIRGIVRVLNLCFHKAVYVHTTLDGWQSHFDLLAEYVPGSSDGETDRFSFRLMLTPPFEAEGTRVEFCLRYESQAGTFWANNRGTNYIVFCHQRWRTEMKENEKEKEREREKLIEENNNKGIRSCLKTNSKVICTETTPTEMSREISEQVAPWTTRTKESIAEKIAEITSPKSLKDYCTPLGHMIFLALLGDDRQMDLNITSLGRHMKEPWTVGLHDPRQQYVSHTQSTNSPCTPEQEPRIWVTSWVSQEDKCSYIIIEMSQAPEDGSHISPNSL